MTQTLYKSRNMGNCQKICWFLINDESCMRYHKIEYYHEICQQMQLNHCCTYFKTLVSSGSPLMEPSLFRSTDNAFNSWYGSTDAYREGNENRFRFYVSLEAVKNVTKGWSGGGGWMCTKSKCYMKWSYWSLPKVAKSIWKSFVGLNDIISVTMHSSFI